MKEALLIFAKNLVPGKVKTRLAATIGNDRAFAVYKQLLHHTAAVTRRLPVDKLVFYSDFIEEADCWKGAFQKHLQNGASLGERMENAFVVAFNKGYEKVVIIGTDIPALDEEIIRAAFDALNQIDVVIGPANDGGYFLLGMKTNHPGLFHNIEWSTSAVYSATVSKIKERELTYHCLPTFTDVDEEKDLYAMLSLQTNQ
ncbi:TIGR04282 family arsenosugar biosynthesis glycosyltransferase [Flavisolibacter sp. BT320]|nr:TIGR04282 family arsenosugar biosynthesis glycosyltransferase [Flavisolibacter longurius]